MTLASIIRGHRLIVCVGSGGVGKTTLSAAIGVAAARQGKRALVVTADPAKRLADALGLDELDDRPSQVSSPATGRGELFAAMLDTKGSFDGLIERIAGDPTRARRILANPTYRAFSRTLARSHAYATSERLYEALNDDRWDTIILDTPPAQSAVEILDAPARLVRFLDGRVATWFLGGVAQAQGSPRGGAATHWLLETLAGGSTVSSLVGFLSEMSALRDGFHARSTVVRDALRSDKTGFVLITNAVTTQLVIARGVYRDLRDRQLPVDAVVFNRGYRHEPGMLGRPLEPPSSQPREPRALAEKLTALRTEGVAANDAKLERMRTFVWRLDPKPAGSRLPEVSFRLADVAALAGWAEAALPIA